MWALLPKCGDHQNPNTHTNARQVCLQAQWWKARDRRILGAQWQTSLAENGNPTFSKRLCPKLTGRRVVDSRCPDAQEWTHTHTHTCNTPKRVRLPQYTFTSHYRVGEGRGGGERGREKKSGKSIYRSPRKSSWGLRQEEKAYTVSLYPFPDTRTSVLLLSFHLTPPGVTLDDCTCLEALPKWSFAQ